MKMLALMPESLSQHDRFWAFFKLAAHCSGMYVKTIDAGTPGCFSQNYIMILAW
jgi:hypothetical protein